MPHSISFGKKIQIYANLLENNLNNPDKFLPDNPYFVGLSLKENVTLEDIRDLAIKSFTSTIDKKECIDNLRSYLKQRLSNNDTPITFPNNQRGRSLIRRIDVPDIGFCKMNFFEYEVDNKLQLHVEMLLPPEAFRTASQQATRVKITTKPESVFDKHLNPTLEDIDATPSIKKYSRNSLEFQEALKSLALHLAKDYNLDLQIENLKLAGNVTLKDINNQINLVRCMYPDTKPNYVEKRTKKYITSLRPLLVMDKSKLRSQISSK